MYPPSAATVLVAQQVTSKLSLDRELMVGFPCELLTVGFPHRPAGTKLPHSGTRWLQERTGGPAWGLTCPEADMCMK